MEADLSVLKSYAVTIDFPAFHMTIYDDFYAKMAEEQGPNLCKYGDLIDLFCLYVLWHSLENCCLKVKFPFICVNMYA